MMLKIKLQEHRQPIIIIMLKIHLIPTKIQKMKRGSNLIIIRPNQPHHEDLKEL